MKTWSARTTCCKFCPRRLCPRCRWGLCPDPKLARRWRFQNACIGGCAPPALGYDFGETSPTTPFRRFQEAPGSEAAPRRLLVTMSSRPYWQARFGSSKRCPYQRLCSANFWLCFSRDIYIYICWLRPQIIMRACCACDPGDGPHTCMQSCGEAPGCGVQLLDWADPRARTTRPTPGAPTRRTEYRRQGRERPLGVDASKLIRLACSMWPVRMLAESDAGKRNLVGELSARR